MTLALTLEEVANIAILIAPGYFFIVGYELILSRDEKNFSKLLVESIAFSLPLVGVYNALWRKFVDSEIGSVIRLKYFVPLILGSLLVGFAVSHLRQSRWLEAAAEKLKLPSADGDFIRVQFRRLGKATPVTVTLKNGEIFSGTPRAGSSYSKGHPREYLFNNFAWYRPSSEGDWEDREGSLIINLESALYMEIGEKLDPSL